MAKSLARRAPMRHIRAMAPERLAVSGGAREDDPRRGGADVLERPRTKKPRMYRVVMLNDDYTPAFFVVEVLERHFDKSREDAARLTAEIHQRGAGTCGVYALDVAETKVKAAMDDAKAASHPLQLRAEPE
jgi:ATP-dependent Clp protease adaptor protein ClpS